MSRKVLPFNLDWNYAPHFEKSMLGVKHSGKGFENVTLPHTNAELPYNYFDEKAFQFVSCYRKAFKIPVVKPDERVYLDFEGVMAAAEIYLNGRLVGSHKGGYTPFSILLGGAEISGKKNTLVVVVDSTERKDIPPFGGSIDYLTYGGIYREAFLRIVPELSIKNLFAKPKDVLLDLKRLDLTVFLENASEHKHQIEIRALLKSGKKTLASASVENPLVRGSESSHEIHFRNLKGIELWDLKVPRLYDLEVSLVENGKVVDTVSRRIGFRECQLTENGFFLNGEKLKLRGLNRHQAFPYMGYAMGERAQKKDADILKTDLGLNCVRTSHYPQSTHFLDRCDEIGLLVLEEIPGWQHIGDAAWKKSAVESVREMIERDWNHPSIFLWGVRINESPDDHAFYSETNRLARELDPTRPTGGIRCIVKSELLEDVYTMNDFIHQGTEKILRDQREVTGLEKNVPYLVTEYGGHMFPTKRFDQEERLVEHALRHVRIQNRSALDPHIAGAIGWCAFDYNTHHNFGSGDRICYHGVMDMFRIPKYAAHFYRSQKPPSEEAVLEPATWWTHGERSVGGVMPLYLFTNCDLVELHVAGKKVGEYQPDRIGFPGLVHPPILIKEKSGEWGGVWNEALFVGKIGGKTVARKKFAKDPVPSKLEALADDPSLRADGMDSTRVVVRALDQVGNILPYFNAPLNYSLRGPGKILGPTQSVLIGGATGLWLRTGTKKGTLVMHVECPGFASVSLKVQVR